MESLGRLGHAILDLLHATLHVALLLIFRWGGEKMAVGAMIAPLKQGIEHMEVTKELATGISFHGEVKDGQLVIQVSAGLGTLVQLADDKIENPVISAILQGLKAVIVKL